MVARIDASWAHSRRLADGSPMMPRVVDDEDVVQAPTSVQGQLADTPMCRLGQLWVGSRFAPLRALCAMLVPDHRGGCLCDRQQVIGGNRRTYRRSQEGLPVTVLLDTARTQCRLITGAQERGCSVWTSSLRDSMPKRP